jgi:hypothetical protein
MISQRSKIITVDRLCCAKFSRVIFLIVLVEFDKSDRTRCVGAHYELDLVPDMCL